ncbi:glycosyltransferase family 2 protein [Sutcliffiella horikoshii]|uniref:glycosyltransferase family 2 protein n=1 Tax=Sutcliffiella horikoshii TaxID=79883 RepID=UPI003CF145C8
MKKGIIKLLSNILDFSIYKLFNQNQREYFSNFVTDQNKKNIKKYLRLGKSRLQINEVETIKYYMNNLGFTERGLQSLIKILVSEKKSMKTIYAAKELSLWYANQYDKDSASMSLSIIEKHLSEVKATILERQITIMKSEAYLTIGDSEQAKKVINSLLSLNQKPHPDVLLAAANLENSLPKKIKIINQMLDSYGLSNITLNSLEVENVYDRLLGIVKGKADLHTMPKVSIIVPMYNSEKVIETALQALMSQTWTNIEIIAVDDCSTDGTVDKVLELSRLDSRIKLIQTKENGGAYIARNTALQEATGEFITINDADDWSHPEKIEKQVTHLIKTPRVIGNISQQARATNELQFYRRGKFGIYIFGNMSSFMFRRERVIQEIGYWDSVRFGADSEYIKRIKKVFGENSIVQLNTGPLSFQRQTETSLTGNSAFGFPGFFMGARREYVESHEFFHSNHSSLYYPFPQKVRSFPVPEPMLPNRKDNGTKRELDSIIVSDFRQQSSTLKHDLEIIKLLIKNNKRIGLIQMYKFDLNTHNIISSQVRSLIDGENIQMLVYGEEVTCKELLILNPSVFTDFQKYVPNVIPDNIKVLINEIPQKGSKTLDEFEIFKEHINKTFGDIGVWYPKSTEIRKKLEIYSINQLDITLSEQNGIFQSKS